MRTDLFGMNLTLIKKKRLWTGSLKMMPTSSEKPSVCRRNSFRRRRSWRSMYTSKLLTTMSTWASVSKEK